jgi:hypothetical protein
VNLDRPENEETAILQLDTVCGIEQSWEETWANKVLLCRQPSQLPFTSVNCGLYSIVKSQSQIVGSCDVDWLPSPIFHHSAITS